MAKFDANYRIVLRSEMPKSELAFLAALGEKIAGPGGAPLYQLTCTEADFSHPEYLEVKVFKDPEPWLLPLYIPHQCVLAVSAQAEHVPIGFAPWEVEAFA
jgi:hypothetical protein